MFYLNAYAATKFFGAKPSDRLDVDGVLFLIVVIAQYSGGDVMLGARLGCYLFRLGSTASPSLYLVNGLWKGAVKCFRQEEGH